jgi:hypothetical protein
LDVAVGATGNITTLALEDDGAELDAEGAMKELGGGITTVAIVVISLVMEVVEDELVVGAPIPPSALHYGV